MRILFIGCVESSYRLLERLLLGRKNVVGVITRKGAGRHADFVDLGPLCRGHGVPVCHVEDINGTGAAGFIRERGPDIGFCFGWSQLLEEGVIGMFPQGVVGFHPAALPANRGRHPLVWALALGLEETASTFFMLNAGADEGDVVSQRPIPIAYEDDARALYDKVVEAAVAQEVELVEAFEKGAVQRTPQEAGRGNCWRRRGEADGRIDWRMPSRGIYNLVRGLARPYVGAHFVYGGKAYRVWKVQELGDGAPRNIEPGKVLASEGGVLDVKTGDGAVRLLQFEAAPVGEGGYLL